MLKINTLIFSAAILGACSSGIQNTPYATTVDDRAVNSVVPALYLGQQFIVRLPSKPGTGYHWIPVNEANAILAQQGESSYQTLQGTVQVSESPSIETLSFKTLNKGTQRLRLEYRQPWDIKSAKKEVFYDVTVK